jgi:hypothetical protein
MKLKAFLRKRRTHTHPGAKNIPLGASGFYTTRERSEAVTQVTPGGKRGCEPKKSQNLATVGDCRPKAGYRCSSQPSNQKSEIINQQ